MLPVYSLYDIQLKFNRELEEQAVRRGTRSSSIDLGRGTMDRFGGDDRRDAHIIRSDRYSPLVFELDDGYECGLALLKEGSDPSAETSHRRKGKSEGLVWEDHAYEALVRGGASVGACRRILTGQCAIYEIQGTLTGAWSCPASKPGSA